MYIIYIYIHIYIYEYVYVYSTVVSFAPISNPQLSLTIIITTIIIITIITRHTFLVSMVLGIGMQSQAHPAIIRGSRIRGHGCLSRPSESACLAENEAWTNETCEGSTGKYWYVGFLEKWGKKTNAAIFRYVPSRPPWPLILKIGSVRNWSYYIRLYCRISIQGIFFVSTTLDFNVFS